MEPFASMLTGGHQNSLGRTQEVVDAVLVDTMRVLGAWATHDPGLARWLRPHARRLASDDRASVAKNARKLLDLLGP